MNARVMPLQEFKVHFILRNAQGHKRKKNYHVPYNCLAIQTLCALPEPIAYG